MGKDGTNLYEIYLKVLQRRNRGSAELGVWPAAQRAADCAQKLCDFPNQENLKVFRRAEMDWASISGRSRTSYADEFENAIQSGNYFVKITGVNSAWNTRYQPKEGYIYGAISNDRTGWIKLGATVQSPLDRLEQFKKKYMLKHIELMYYARVTDPLSVENEIQKCLRIYRRQQSDQDSREWFEVSPEHAFETAQRAIERLRCGVIVPPTRTTQMRAIAQLPMGSVGWIRHGGRLAISDRPAVDVPATGGSFFTTAENKPDLISRVAEANAPFPLGARVVLKRNWRRFGIGVVVSINAQNTSVKFQSDDKPRDFATSTASEFLVRYEPA